MRDTGCSLLPAGIVSAGQVRMPAGLGVRVIAAPPPLDVTLPGSPQGAGQAGAGALTIGADGTLAFGDLRGDAALSAAVAASGGDAVELRADAGLEATRLARILAQLAAAGVEETRLLTVAR